MFRTKFHQNRMINKYFEIIWEGGVPPSLGSYDPKLV